MNYQDETLVKHDLHTQQEKGCANKFTLVLWIFFCIVGPDTWAEEFPVANDGPRQSPINIIPKEAKYDSSLKPLKLRYDPSNAKGILNNGHSFQVDYVDDTDSSSKHSWFGIFIDLLMHITFLHICKS